MRETDMRVCDGDSQNNGNGGYPYRGEPTLQGIPDPLAYFPDSKLEIQFTVQHGLGADNNVESEMILQYACEDSLPGLRDGYPMGDITQNGQDDLERREFLSNNQNQDGTNTVPLPDNIDGVQDPTEAELNDFYINGVNFKSDHQCLWLSSQSYRLFSFQAQLGDDYGVEFGMHESYSWYKQVALNTERNKGLYTADRNLGGDTARYTRQNNGGTRRGFEVPDIHRHHYHRRLHLLICATLL